MKSKTIRIKNLGLENMHWEDVEISSPTVGHVTKAFIHWS